MEKYISWGDVIKKVEGVAKAYPGKRFYGVPRGGSVVAAMLNPVDTPDEADVIIDDLIDSGRTRDKYCTMYPDKPFVALYTKDEPVWLCFPWELEGDKDIEDSVVRILEYIGENPNREGLLDTPKRVVKSWKEIYGGYSTELPKITVFDNGSDGLVYDQMILDTGSFNSTCEHHMLPFVGSYYFAYIPHTEGKILGLSKVARVVEYYSSRLQIQERLGGQVVDALWNALTDEGTEKEPLAMGLVLQATHMCKCVRGVKNKGTMTTSCLRGNLMLDATKSEFLSFIQLCKNDQ